jgi:nicotinate phosphoribosyltransferase
MRIGIMGAKGDPWHWMHFLVAELARVQHKLDRVYLVTAGQPVDKNDVTDKEIRHLTLTSVAGDDPYLIPSRVEIDREGKSYMSDTLRHFKKVHGDDAELFLIIGEDRAPTIVNWHEPEAICQLATFIIAPRMGLVRVEHEWLRSVLPKGARFETIELELSSSFIRKQREKGLNVRWLVPAAGITVLDEHQLYAAKATAAPNTDRRKGMIRSILDNDLYKFTMQWAVLKLYPHVRVGYRFTDRKAKGKWTQAAVEELRRRINAMAELALTAEERAKAEAKMPWMHPGYWDYLANYRFDPSEVKVSLDAKNNLQIDIRGLWHRTILWEVPLMALVCEVWYEMIDTNWTEDGQYTKMVEKAQRLAEAGVLWGDFGTRRRRNLGAQERVVQVGKAFKNFTGTSNVYLALKYDVKPLGTMAHEWIMAHSALFSLKHANRYALRAWNDVYQGNLGTALPDTFGTDAFLRDFDGQLARLFDSVRHDSGDPKEWAEKMIAHYTKLSIDWKSKPLGFTDGNTDQSAIALHKWVMEKGGKCWFGIGTSLSNDYEGSPALSIVIKLAFVEDPDGGAPIYVVKISDTPEKATGDTDALRVAMWTHFGTPLDSGVKLAAPGVTGATTPPAEAGAGSRRGSRPPGD